MAPRAAAAAKKSESVRPSTRTRGKWFETPERKTAKAFRDEHEMRLWEIKHYGPLEGKRRRLVHRSLYCGHDLPNSVLQDIDKGRIVAKEI